MTGSALSTRYAARVILLSMRLWLRSDLAARAEIGRSLSLPDAPYHGTADTAGPASAFINIKSLAKISGIAVGADVVAQRGAAGANGRIQRRAHRASQASAIGTRQATRSAPGTDAGAEQGFAGVDVADSGDQPPVHQHLLDGGATAARDAMQILGIEFGFQRLGRQRAQQFVLLRILGGVVQTAEATRVVEPQALARLDQQIELV